VFRRKGRGAEQISTSESELVEVGRVPLWRGPLLQNHLQENGIPVVGEECFSLVTRSLTDYRLLVARQDALRAETLLGELN
jgi:hypothetical protein